MRGTASSARAWPAFTLAFALVVGGCGLSDAEDLWCDTHTEVVVSQAVKTGGLDHDTLVDLGQTGLLDTKAQADILKAHHQWDAACKATYANRETLSGPAPTAGSSGTAAHVRDSPLGVPTDEIKALFEDADFKFAAGDAVDGHETTIGRLHGGIDGQVTVAGDPVWVIATLEVVGTEPSPADLLLQSYATAEIRKWVDDTSSRLYLSVPPAGQQSKSEQVFGGVRVRVTVYQDATSQLIFMSVGMSSA